MTAYEDMITGTTGVTRYYRFEGNGNDSIGTAHMTIATGYSTANAGKRGKGLSADANTKTGSYVSGISGLFGSEYSIEFWFKYASNASAQELMRVADDVALEMNPNGTILYYYKGTSGTTTGAYNDNAWHHLVITRDASRNVIVYIDGTSRITFTAPTGSPTAGNTYFAGSQYTSQAARSGYMDEISIYSVALSSTTVNDHLLAGNSSEFTADTPTATIQGVEGTYEGHGQVVTISEDGTRDNQGGGTIVYITNADTVEVDAFSDNRAYFKFDVSSIAGGAAITITKATLRLVVQSVRSTGQVTAYPGTDTTVGKVFTSSGTPAGYVWELDVTNGITNLGGNNRQVQLNYPATGEVGWVKFHSSESATSTSRPVLEVTYTITPVDVEVNLSTVTATIQGVTETVETVRNTEYLADTATASTASVEPEVSSGVGVSADTATASLTAPDATVEAVVSPDVTLDMETATGYVLAPEPSVSINSTVDADDTDTVLLGAYDPDIELTMGAEVILDTPRITTSIYRVTDINGEPVVPTESEDPYFVSTWRTLTSVRRAVTGGIGSGSDEQMSEDFAVWLRLDEKSGSVAKDRADTVPPYDPAAAYHNVALGQFNGPNGRHSVYFNGDAWMEETIEGANYLPTSLEFTFRTEKATQFIMGGTGIVPTTYASGYTWWDIWLVDGKLEYRIGANSYDRLNGRFVSSHSTMTGFDNLADDQWHHVVVQASPARTVGGLPNAGTEIYIDGTLEIRRRTTEIIPDAPDFIGGRYESDVYPGRRTLSGGEWFVGDMTEVVFRNGRTLSVDELTLQRDNVMGILPVRPATARITTTAPDAIAKGNKARILVLDFGREDRVLWRSDQGPLAEQYASTMGGRNIGYEAFDFDGLGQRFGENAQVIMFKEYVINDYRRDNVTDNPRVIDLDVDVNMDDFDIISIINYPQTPNQWRPYDIMDEEAVPPYTTARMQVEQLMNQIKGFVRNGVNLHVSDPASAIALGIVDRVDFVPKLMEQVFLDNRVGATTGLYDWYSAKTNPWHNQFHIDPSPNLASRFLDTHANVKQRVRNLVPGLTDIPSWILTDFQVWQNADPMATPPAADFMRHEPRLNGLAIGDEFYLEGSGIGHSKFDWALSGEPGWGTRGWRATGYAAAPVANIKAGKAVTTFGNELWMDDDRVENPYKDHAVVIVIEPGDMWDGVASQGKVYVNFTEYGANYSDYIGKEYFQLLSLTDANPEYRYWTFTHERGTWTGTKAQAGGSGETFISINAEGEIELGVQISEGEAPRNSKNSQKPGESLIAWAWKNAGPVETITVLNMNNRALTWLAKDATEDGNANVGVATANVTVKTEQQTVETQKNAYVDLATARSQAEANNLADVEYADVSVLVTTPSVTVNVGAFRETVDLSTATVTARAYDDANTGLDFADVIDLTLPFHSIDLILEEV